MSLELFILPNVGGYHSFDLLVVKHESETPVVNATVIRNHSQVVGSMLAKGVDQVSRDTAKSKSTYTQSLTIIDILSSLQSTWVDL